MAMEVFRPAADENGPMDARVPNQSGCTARNVHEKVPYLLYLALYHSCIFLHADIWLLYGQLVYMLIFPLL